MPNIGYYYSSCHITINMAKWNMFCDFIDITMACVIRPSVNPLQNREIQHVNIGLQSMYQFLSNQIWKEIMVELNGKPSSVTTISTDFSFQNMVFWNLFEFSTT